MFSLKVSFFFHWFILLGAEIEIFINNINIVFRFPIVNDNEIMYER